jgi:hypothetical protein
VDSSMESISDTENWLNWNGDFDNPNESVDNREADNESVRELDNSSNVSESPEQQMVRVALNVPRLIRSIRWLNKQVEKAFRMINIMERKRNKAVKKT